MGGWEGEQVIHFFFFPRGGVSWGFRFLYELLGRLGWNYLPTYCMKRFTLRTRFLLSNTDACSQIQREVHVHVGISQQVILQH